MKELYLIALKKECRELAEAFLDILYGCKGPYEIQEDTGLSMKRCEEIYKLYRKLSKDFMLHKL